MTLLPIVALACVAAAHLLPALGIFGSSLFRRIYGSAAMPPETELLLRHRAAMFAVLAAMSIAAIFAESWRTPTLLFALGSITAFIVLWLVSGVRAREVKRVALIDIILVPVVGAGLVAAHLT